MNYDSILTNVRKHIKLSEEEETHFVSILSEEKISKKGLLLRQDAYCKSISFVQKGMLRAYHLNEKGKEFTIMFAIVDWWITDMNAFLNKRKSDVSIVAIEDSVVWNLGLNEMEELCLQIPKFERFFRILMQNAYVREQKRTMENLSLTAEKRYSNFIDKYPDFFNRVSQKQLASYLGITPEFLSMLRKNRTFS